MSPLDEIIEKHAANLYGEATDWRLKLSLDTTARATKTTVGETSHASDTETKPKPQRYGLSLLAGVDTATWRPVVGVAGEYKWARLMVSADPREPSKVTVMAGAGFHW